MIDLVSSFIMLASVFYSQPGTTVSPTPQAQNMKQKTTEELVRDYFADTPILVEVARCESTFRQTDSTGKVIRGRVNEYDVGVMQINELYHADKAEELGYDLHTIEGNMAYAKWLYEKESIVPWKSSSRCWKNSKEITRA